MRVESRTLLYQQQGPSLAAGGLHAARLELAVACQPVSSCLAVLPAQPVLQPCQLSAARLSLECAPASAASSTSRGGPLAFSASQPGHVSGFTAGHAEPICMLSNVLYHCLCRWAQCQGTQLVTWTRMPWVGPSREPWAA